MRAWRLHKDIRNFAFEMQIFLMNNHTRTATLFDFINEARYELFILLTVVLVFNKKHSVLCFIEKIGFLKKCISFVWFSCNRKLAVMSPNSSKIQMRQKVNETAGFHCSTSQSSFHFQYALAKRLWVFNNESPLNSYITKADMENKNITMLLCIVFIFIIITECTFFF